MKKKLRKSLTMQVDRGKLRRSITFFEKLKKIKLGDANSSSSENDENKSDDEVNSIKKSDEDEKNSSPSLLDNSNKAKFKRLKTMMIYSKKLSQKNFNEEEEEIEEDNKSLNSNSISCTNKFPKIRKEFLSPVREIENSTIFQENTAVSPMKKKFSRKINVTPAKNNKTLLSLISIKASPTVNKLNNNFKEDFEENRISFETFES